MELKDWFEKGVTFEQYKTNMNVNRENVQSIYDRFSLTEEDKKALTKGKEKKLKAIVLTEDWCGDAMVNIPIFMKINEYIDLDTRFLVRDQNLELMDQYLTNGTSRAIPIFIIINDRGEELAVWGPRAKEAQQLVDSYKEKLPAKEASDFKEKQQEMFNNLTKTFLKDETLWRAIGKSIIEKLSTIF